MKRLFDTVVALTAILILSPVFLIICLAIKLSSPGEIIFRQRRVGKNERPFQIYKFRTMINIASLNSREITPTSDPRITKVGRLLRRTKLDELPQLFNVVKGEMSLVGPRPEVPKYVAQYPYDVRKLVLSVRPGMTDLASIRYRNESDLLDGSTNPEMTYVNEVLPIKLRYYVEYVQRRSFFFDLRIILLTIRAVVKDK